MGEPRQTFLRSNTSDPAINLACEEYLMSQCREDEVICFLWQSHPSVIIGKHQNPYTECHLGHMKEDGVKLMRRMSGGGTVYQDEGNLNYTFIAPKTLYNMQEHFLVIIKALKSVGVEASVNERNDITVDGYKISGSAFVHHKNISCHHGTLLVNADIGALWHYLNPDMNGLRGKGIASCKSKVMNLSQQVPRLTVDLLCEKIRQSLDQTYEGLCKDQGMIDHGMLQAYTAKYKTWDWTIGETPKFTVHQKLRNHGVDGCLTIDVRSGHIESCHLSIPMAMGDDIDCLNKLIRGKPFVKASFTSVTTMQLCSPEILEALEAISDLCIDL